MAKEKKKSGKGKKICLWVFLSILIALLLFLFITEIIARVGSSANLKLAKSFSPVKYEEQLKPKYDEENDSYYFETDRDLKVLQITDVHLGSGFSTIQKDTMAINAVATMVTTEKPDLVVVTGDIAYPVPFQGGTINNKISANIFATLMETLGVYWVPMYGNHDTELYSLYSREDISEFYSSPEFSYCLFKTGPEDVDGYGNSYINVKNSDGIITQTLFMLDSHSYTDGDYFGALWKYDNLKDNQVDFYQNACDKFIAENEKTIDTLYSNDTEKAKELKELYCQQNSLLFFHIPIREYREAWTEYKENGYKDTENVKHIYGTVAEKNDTICSGVHEDKLFETMVQHKGNMGIFCGHDHLNNFSLDYKGIRLTFGYSIDYLAYIGIMNYGLQRGCTVINVKNDGTFDCEKFNYYDEKYQSLNGYEKEVVIMTPFPVE